MKVHYNRTHEVKYIESRLLDLTLIADIAGAALIISRAYNNGALQLSH